MPPENGVRSRLYANTIRVIGESEKSPQLARGPVLISRYSQRAIDSLRHKDPALSDHFIGANEDHGGSKHIKQLFLFNHLIGAKKS
jgi:hypothetical protein